LGTVFLEKDVALKNIIKMEKCSSGVWGLGFGVWGLG